MGVWSSMGMANGLVDSAGVVENSATKVGGAALNAVKSALSNIANELDSSPDFTPSIRPILDLSGVQESASGIYKLFPNKPLNLDSTIQLANQTRSAIEDSSDGSPTNGTNETSTDISFVQNITSPKALSPSEIYRNTKNLFSKAKDEFNNVD